MLQLIVLTFVLEEILESLIMKYATVLNLVLLTIGAMMEGNVLDRGVQFLPKIFYFVKKNVFGALLVHGNLLIL